MAKIRLNDSKEFDIETFSQTNYYHDGEITRSANFNITDQDISELEALASTSITLIEIIVKNNTIYTLDNVNGRLDNINEFLENDHMSKTVTIEFTNT